MATEQAPATRLVALTQRECEFLIDQIKMSASDGNRKLGYKLWSAAAEMDAACLVTATNSHVLEARAALAHVDGAPGD